MSQGVLNMALKWVLWIEVFLFGGIIYYTVDVYVEMGFGFLISDESEVVSKLGPLSEVQIWSDVDPWLFLCWFIWSLIRVFGKALEAGV